MKKPAKVLTFGKYKGKTIGEVLKVDAQYLEWLVDIGQLDNLDSRLINRIYTAAAKEQADWYRETYGNEQVEY